MDTNAKRVLEAMPDFNDELEMLEVIKKLTIEKMKLDAAIKADESTNFTEVMTNPKYFVGGKPVAVSYYENAYKYKGIDNNLMVLRGAIIETIAELDLLKSKYEVYKQMQDMYKSLVFAERQ